jgi:hypothetical protein
MTLSTVYVYDHRIRFFIISISCLSLFVITIGLGLYYRVQLDDIGNFAYVLAFTGLIGFGALIFYMRSKRIEFYEDHATLYDGRKLPRDVQYSELSVLAVVGGRNSSNSFRLSSKSQSSLDSSSFSWTILNDKITKLDYIPLYYWLFTKTTGKQVVFKTQIPQKKWIRQVRIVIIPIGIILLIGGPYYFWNLDPATGSDVTTGFICGVIGAILLFISYIVSKMSKVRVPVRIDESGDSKIV